MYEKREKGMFAGLFVLMGAVFIGKGFLAGVAYRLHDYHVSYVECNLQMRNMVVICMAVTVLLLICLIYILVPTVRMVFLNANRVHIEENRCIRAAATELKDNVRQLQDEYCMKERANKAKSKFMNRMSHDLRTPMNAIMGYSFLLEDNADDPEKVGYYARKISLSGQNLLGLINDVLDMSSIESGNLKLVNSAFSIESALEEIKSSVKPQTAAKEQQFNCYLSNSSGKDRFVGDKQRFCQILRNLLSNAVKYTPEGGTVDLIMNIIETGHNECQLLCQIKDNGCGMSKAFVDKIFRPFEREDNMANETVQGNGLGMSIAKSCVELMNGTITVESELNVGTLITVMIPLCPDKENAEINRFEYRNKERMEGLRFLAAEDNESNAEILTELLAVMGAECVVAADGQAVVDVFKSSEPDEFDAILMDIQMPVMNGYRAAAAIRKCGHPRAEEIAILAMTADAFEEDVQKAFVSGMNGHIAKPLDLQVFINTVEQFDLHSKKGKC